MNRTIHIPTEKLSGFGLHEGDHFTGVVDGSVVRVSVVSGDAPATLQTKRAAGRAFLKNWTGSAKALRGQDVADDPRAEYLLGR